MIPDPTLYPYLHALHGVLTEQQWSDLFANRLAKRTAAQMLCKKAGIIPGKDELEHLSATIAQEMHRFRPIKPRPPGAKLLI